MDITGTDDGEVINGTSGNDTIDAKGGNDEVHAGDGSDSVSGGTGDDTLYGDGGNDSLDGGRGNDIVYGGDGADSLGSLFVNQPYYSEGESDRLDGGVGNDTLSAEPTFDSSGTAINRTVAMYGGTGDDKYFVRFSDQNTIFENPGEGTDTIVLMYRVAGEGNVFYMPANVEYLQGVLGTQAIGYDAATGKYDHLARQTIVGNALDNYIVTNAELGGVKSPTGNMTILAGAGSDSVYSDAGNDTLFGEAGDDYLSGGTGIDTLVGGEGNDNLDTGYFETDAPSPDALYGGTGNDTYGIDHAGDIAFENPGEGTDTALVRIQNGGWYAFPNIENIWSSSSTLTFLVGNAQDNDIRGGAASELLLGGDGTDFISGDLGNDSIFGENGDDFLSGGDGVDYVVGGAGKDVVQGGNNADALYGEDGDDTIYGGNDFATDIMVGGVGNDIIYGNSGLGDYDRMNGGAGNDKYYVDTPDDLTFEAANDGIDSVYADIKGAGLYLYANVENLYLQGTTSFGVGNELDNLINATGSTASANVALLGGAGNDTLEGSEGANGMYGETGNDALYGWGGDDVLVGGDGDDFIDGGNGNDVMVGGAGKDTFYVGTSGLTTDYITDFEHGIDKITLPGYSSFAQLQSHIYMVGSDTVIEYSTGGRYLVLQNVNMSVLNGADFGYSGNAASEQLASASAPFADDDAIGPAGFHNFLAQAPILEMYL